MKMNEMIQICNEQKGKCIKCKLNCVKDWETKKTSWCLLIVKRSYAIAYKKYIDEGNEILAERVKMTYEQIEKESLQ